MFSEDVAASLRSFDAAFALCLAVGAPPSLRRCTAFRASDLVLPALPVRASLGTSLLPASSSSPTITMFSLKTSSHVCNISTKNSSAVAKYQPQNKMPGASVNTGPPGQAYAGQGGHFLLSRARITMLQALTWRTVLVLNSSASATRSETTGVSLGTSTTARRLEP